MRAFQLRGFDRISSAFCKGFECFEPTLSAASSLSAGMPFVCEKNEKNLVDFCDFAWAIE